MTSITPSVDPVVVVPKAKMERLYLLLTMSYSFLPVRPLRQARDFVLSVLEQTA